MKKNALSSLLDRFHTFRIFKVYRTPSHPLWIKCWSGHSASWLGLAVCSGNTECTDTGCLGTVYRYGSKCTSIPEPTQGAELSLSLSLSLTKLGACEEDEFIVVRNERGKANIWRHFGFRKRKTDNTIVENIAVCNSWERERESPSTITVPSPHLPPHTHTHARTRTHTHTLCTHSPLPSFGCIFFPPTYTSPRLPTFPQSLSLLPVCPWQRNKEPSKPGVEVKLLTVAIDVRRERESKSLQHCVLWYTGAKYRLGVKCR